jgi:uncharacterized protein YqeY
MKLQEKIKKDMMQAMKEKDEEKKSALRIMMGEFARAESKVLSDDAVIQVIKKMVKSERETLERSGRAEDDTRYLQILESYLPKLASDEEIEQWITGNIDFTKYKNKMQAMKDIMGHFGSAADGSRVKEILQKL